MKERIYDLLHAREFRPFTILMNDGEKYPVLSRDHAIVAPGRGTFVFVIDDNDRGTFLAIRNISGVQTDQSATLDLQSS